MNITDSVSKPTRVGNGFTVKVRNVSNHPGSREIVSKLSTQGFNIAIDNKDIFINDILCLEVIPPEGEGKAIINVFDSKRTGNYFPDSHEGYPIKKYQGIHDALLTTGFSFNYYRGSK